MPAIPLCAQTSSSRKCIKSENVEQRCSIGEVFFLVSFNWNNDAPFFSIDTLEVDLYEMK